jgi:hypothetical protein
MGIRTSIITDNYPTYITSRYPDTSYNHYYINDHFIADYNVAVGPYSMGNVFGGSNNVAVGSYAGNNNETFIANKCTFVGAYSRAVIPDDGNLPGTHINNSTAIGHDAVVTGDNQIVIGTRGENVFIPCPTVSIGKISKNYALDVSGIVSATSVIQTSDYRIKTEIVDLSLSQYSVDSLRPVSYKNTLLDGGSDGVGVMEMGFLAHEVQDIFPFLVSGEKDGAEYQTLNYTGLISLLVKEIQDLKLRVSELEK